MLSLTPATRMTLVLPTVVVTLGAVASVPFPTAIPEASTAWMMSTPV